VRERTPIAETAKRRLAVQYSRPGKRELKVSRLSFDASSLGGIFHPVSEEEAIAAVHAALDAGISYFDVALAYRGTLAEAMLGKALRGVPGNGLFRHHSHS
jgi:aryl-alcohol dehydrogenase-like predicted oxidoreductase